MSSYDPTWTESVEEASEYAREANEADLRDWENEQRRDREIRMEHPMNKMASQEERRKALEPRYKAAVDKFYGKDAA